MGGRSSSFNNTSVISEHTGDVITLDMAKNKWARNATNIKNASQGQKYDPNKLVGNTVGINDEAAAKVLENYVDNHVIDQPIYRGISNVSADDLANYTTVGGSVNEKGLSSWSTNEQTSVGYANKGDNNILFVKTTSTENARKLGLQGMNENEVIVHNLTSKIKKVEKTEYYTKVTIG